MTPHHAGARQAARTTAGILIVAVLLFPLYWMVNASLQPSGALLRPSPAWFPLHATFTGYREAFASQTGHLTTSLVVALGAVAVSLVIALPAAYSFSRFSFRFKNTLNVFIINTQTVPPITLLIPYFGMVVMLGIFDTYFALILTYLVFTLPYAILLLTGYLNTLPRELDEAVLVDGGTNWSALWRVIVPLSVPGIVATAVYTFLLAWNEFLFALTLTKSMSMRTVPIGIELLMGQHAFKWNEMMAMSVLGSLPLLILYLLAQRYFLAGMTAGAVKA